MRMRLLLLALLASVCVSYASRAKIHAPEDPLSQLHITKHPGQSNKHKGALPVVMWHGMGDSAHGSLQAIIDLITRELGVFVLSIATGDGAYGDMLSSYYGNVNDQVAKACAEMQGISELSGGYNAIGFSQGGQFMRAVVERCSHEGIKAHNLITVGAQHQGVTNIPGCNTVPSGLGSTGRDSIISALQGTCETVQAVLAQGAYLPWVRDHVVQAQYWKDTGRMDEYLAFNPFLPDINNERPQKNVQYAKNLASLKRLVLFKFSKDTTVVPAASSWFGVLEGSEVVNLEDQDMYKEDWLGLRELNEAGKLVMKEVDGEHMQFTRDWFESEVLPYLS